MPNNRRRKLSPRLVDVKRDEQKDGSPQSKQVPSDASMCHGSYSNRDDCNYSESSCDIMSDGIENLNLDVKQAKDVRPSAFFIGPELPKVELGYFDGQPRGYWKFLREFETYVESRVKDDGQRLLYLIHYCKGKAKTAIEGCVMLEASFGYKKAKEILKRLFGQAHVIARETLEDLFKTTNVDYSDPEQLTNLAIRMENCSMVLKQMKYTADLNSLITLERIVGLLPQVMQAQWADWVDELTEDNREPTFDELTQFIASRARVANSRFGRLANRPRKGHNVKTNCHLQLEQANNSKEKAKCSVCSLDHAIYKCPKFLALTVQERWSHAKVNGICFVCLRQGHKVSECKLAKRCNVEGCERKHHSLLHSESEKPGTSSCCGYTKSLISQVCLGMIPVRLKSRKAEIVGYALLDNGSDVTLIKSNCLRSLGLSEDEASVVVETVGGNRTMKVTSAPFEVYSLDRSEHVTIEGALIVARIPGHKPTKSAMNNLVKWPHLSDVPIDSLDSEEVLLLIGCDIPEAHWVLDQRLGGRKSPYAVKTLLGWTVFGPALCSEYRKRVVNHTSKLQTLENGIRKRYDVEFSDVYSNDKSLSVDDKTAIRIVEGGTRFVNGHFGVPIPWKVHPNMGGGNYEVANSRLQSLKRRLLKDDILYIKYTNGIERLPTMKGILFIVSSLFDPLGLIAPVCLPAKVLLQKLCKSQIGWDQPLNEPYKSAWPNWVKFMRQTGPRFAGLQRFVARDVVQKALVELGVYRGEKDNPVVVPMCSQSKDIVEPLLKPQWYLRCKDMANAAMKEVSEGRSRIIHSFHIRTWNNWLKDCQDWCISRQLWWGHHIPACHVSIRRPGVDNLEVLDPTDHNSWVVGHTIEEALQKACDNFHCSPDNLTLNQDNDVLDTWFSSQLFLLSGFGWPEQIPDLKAYYPGSLLETGHDIIFFSVARMVMIGLKLMGQLPFHTVYLHAMVRDAHGKKMSRSLGNSVDPVDVINGISLEGLQKQLEQGHAGTSQVLAIIRKWYWIMKATSTVKRVIGMCVTCRRFTMNTGQQLMAPLPACRVQPGWYSFSAVGVDYFGPLVVKRGRSLEKRYGCIFTCLQTRAVHIELTHSLNTDSFIMALLRFIGRRGKPAEIYSDNGSNFVGAVSELRRFVQQLNQQKIDKELSARQIQWHFNPPSASHRGEVWERMIRSIRRLLLLITREQTLTDETLNTYLIEIERILNDRPLTPVVQDANDKLALSPNSLLLLRECDGIVEEGSIRDKYDKRWKQVNHLANVFWKRWLREYLPSLQKRQKWLVEHRNFQKGDVVIVASDISTRGKWPLGVVEDCEIDDDGRVRTVVVRTNGGLVRRDIRRLCLLEGSN
ncbi:unnamed protein product [Schistosoma margrebowiei]|uniref:valine--tRNA ligase n=1 Tax=Schistosoma margrebowiei TaxID=48269 RepID=A0AA85AF94_9TREM|nr:unnamed protein product [Schistosoma margrebowiei]CAH8591004.1 unnamed protein product [Schistosoma margrebowiei]